MHYVGWDQGGGADPEQDVFSVKPVMGEVAAEDFVLICVKFSPQASKKYTQVLRKFSMYVCLYVLCMYVCMYSMFIYTMYVWYVLE